MNEVNSDWKEVGYEVMLGAAVVNGLPNSDSHVEYGLVWKVTPKSKDYPFCFVHAITGELIVFRASCCIT